MSTLLKHTESLVVLLAIVAAIFATLGSLTCPGS